MINNVMFLSTGGTIASTKSEDNRSKAGELTGQNLIDGLSLPNNIKIDTESVFQKPSNALTFNDILFLRDRILAIDKQNKYTGIVITHGTDTLEDTAYLLQASLPVLDTAIVITGSQRAPHMQGTDAYKNLTSAIIAAGSNKLKKLGVLVVFNESIYPVTALPRVDIITACLEASPQQLISSFESGATGIVLEGIGKGHVPPSWIPVVDKLIKDGLRFVVVTGSLMGSLEPTYDFDGCLKDLLDLGVIPISDMSARKARIRLMLALASADPQQSLLTLAITST